jgi:hypothetical protein
MIFPFIFLNWVTSETIENTIVISMVYGTLSHVTPYFKVLENIPHLQFNANVIFAAPTHLLHSLGNFSNNNYQMIQRFDLGGFHSEDRLDGYAQYVEKYKELILETKPILFMCDALSEACQDVAFYFKIKLMVSS